MSEKPSKLALAIALKLFPHGAPTTTYCYPTMEEREAAMQVDRDWKAKTIDGVLSAFLKTHSEIVEALEKVTSRLNETCSDECGDVSTDDQALIQSAKSALALAKKEVGK